MVRPAEIWAHPWQRRGLIALVVVVLYAAAGFLLAPWLIERTLTSTLAERLGLETRVDNLSLNPFTLSLEVDELTTGQPDGETLLAFERLFVNFELMSLFRWAWSFDEIHLIRPMFRFERLTETDSNLSELAARWAAADKVSVDEAAAAVEESTEAAASIPRLVIADLRIVDGRLAFIDQAAGEPFSTDLAPIDLELADFSTLPDQSGRQQVTVRTESGAEVAVTGSLSVNPLALAGAVRLEGTYTPMLFRYFRDELALPLTFDGGAIAATLDYRVAMNDAGEISIALSNLNGTLSGLMVNQPAHQHLIELGTLGITGGSFRWPEQAVGIERISFDDLLVRLYRAGDGSYLPGLTATDDAPAGSIDQQPAAVPSATEEGMEAVAEDAERWRIDVGEIAFNRGRVLHTNTTLENGSNEISALNLSLKDVTLEEGAQMPLIIELAIEPGGTVRLDGALQLFPALELTSALTVSELALAAGQPYLSSIANIAIADGKLSMNGDLSVGGEQPFLYRGDLAVATLSLIDRAQAEDLFAWQRLAVDRLSLSAEALEVSILSIEAPYARIEIEQDGSTNIARTFVEPDPSAAESNEPASETPGATPFRITIGETRVNGGSANFTDLALPLPFQADVTRIEGKLTTFATGSSAASEIELAGQVNEYGALKIDGSISANSPLEATDITVDFDNVNLPSMTPYTVKFAGRAIADGRTDLTLTYRLDDGVLDGNNRLVIRDLTLGEKVEQPGAMDLPLDMAVALLKDGEGKLDFSFPVSGPVDDPEFSYSGAVMKALSNVIGGIVAAPFRLLGSLVGMAPDELEHVGFEPGAATITPPQRETLAKLAEALELRPQLVLEVAPVQNAAADRLAIAERLLEVEIDSLLASSADDKQPHTAALRAALESLFDARHSGAEGAAARDAIAAAHSTEDPAGKPALDVPAYNAALRQALIKSQVVPDLDLGTLAQSRLDAIHEALTALVPLADERMHALPPEEVELNEDGLVQMSLNVTIAD